MLHFFYISFNLHVRRCECLFVYFFLGIRQFKNISLLFFSLYIIPLHQRDVWLF